MKEYDPGMGKSTLVFFIIAIIVVTGVLSAAFILPNLPIEKTTDTNHETTDTTTRPPNGGNNFGPLTADYLTSRRDDVSFYWIYNCTFVNVNLTSYYQETEENAYVDGVKMWRNIAAGYVQVLFSPYYENIIGFGEITISDWDTSAGSLINDGLHQMDDASTHPTDFWNSEGPIDFIVEIYFNDNIYFSLGFKNYYGKVYIKNGTWTGKSTENGWPEIGKSYIGYWLEEDRHLKKPMLILFDTITQSVAYPET